ncbi:YigZ family protein [Hathewaya massiliensis]|uniref:YigZ family protein n=1 Tax=Hathewaya massiliensis TaxID=1964382 RepID=UPI00115BB337|nr:YigZ family protein [Hathewaya massiliensis]
MSYYTIRNRAVSEFDEKKSTFIGHVNRVNTEEEAKAFIEEIKEKYKDARHNVYAYIIGENMGIQRYSDDGEPKGTGGIPVLEVIKKNNLTDTVIVVTRYFGGILLGASGLTRAYSKAAAEAVKEGQIVEKVLGAKVNIEIEYDLLGKVQHSFLQSNIHIEDIEYSDKVILTLFLELDKIEEVEREIMNITSGKGILLRDDSKHYFKLEHRLYEEE